MIITWDEAKRERNIKEHGLNFTEARDRFDFQSALIEETYPSSHGHTRYVALSPIDDELFTVVFSLLGTEALSIISFRPSSKKERNRYEQAFPPT